MDQVIRYPAKGPPIFKRSRTPKPKKPTLASAYDAALTKGGDLDEIARLLGVTAAALRKHINERKDMGWDFEVTAWKQLDNKYAHRNRTVIAAGRLVPPA